MVISIWGIGRSGIASSLVLLLGLLLSNFELNKIYIYYFSYLFVYCLFISSDVLFEFAMDYLHVGNAINHYLGRKMETYDSQRWTMWTNYFNNLDIFRLIFGVNVFEDPWPEGEINEYNYHNSFINLHLQTGFMGIVTIALIIFSLVKYYRTNKIFFFLFFTVILRWSTDFGIFFHAFDFIPFFFIFYFLKRPSLSSASFSKFCIRRRLDISRLLDYQPAKNNIFQRENLKS